YSYLAMEITPYWAILAMAFLVASAVLSKIFNPYQLPKRSPPGPKPWPIVGNLNLLGPLPHQSLHKLSKKYGQLMQLKFGSFPVVIASSAEMAKQFLKTHDHIFASRPPTAAAKYTVYNNCDVAFAPYGPHWRQGRKIFQNELFNSKRLDSYEYIRVEERQAFMSCLYALSEMPQQYLDLTCASPASTISLKAQVSRFTLSIITRIVLGKKYFSESKAEGAIVALEELNEMFDEFFLLNGALNIGDWIPWVDFLDLQGYVKRTKALRKKFDRFYDHVLDEHRANREADKNFAAKDMVDLLLQLADDPNLEVKLNNDGVKGLIQDLITGGSDTVATAIEWAMSELLKQPNLIQNAAEELDRVTGRERWVEEKDFPQLPYLDAILKETMRLHPVAVMLAPHLAIEDCNVAGYDIRKGTRVFINTWSTGRDPILWDTPEKFQPERFLGKEIEVKGQNFELLPFGSGRRMCSGYSLALKMMKSSLANMLHGFNWKLPDDMKMEDLNMEEIYGLTTPRKFPLVALAEPRLPVHLYHLAFDPSEPQIQTSRYALQISMKSAGIFPAFATFRREIPPLHGRETLNDLVSSLFHANLNLTLKFKLGRGMFDELFLLNGVLNVGDWIPSIKLLDLQGYVKRMRSLCMKFDRFRDHVLDENMARRYSYLAMEAPPPWAVLAMALLAASAIISKLFTSYQTRKSTPPGIREEDEVFAHEFDRFHDHVIDEHLGRRVPDKSEKDIIAKDMADLLLQLANDPNLEDLVAGGTDTSTYTVEWPKCELLKQPNLTKKGTEELDRVIGERYWDPMLWDAPGKFKPERFLEEDIDVKGQNFEYCHLVQGGGCARLQSWTKHGSGLANMLHGFNLKWPDNMKIEDLSMEEVYGLWLHLESFHLRSSWSLGSQLTFITSELSRHLSVQKVSQEEQ
ncbi:hypothetical protein RJ640_009142, partial [Escallonia rubra]